MWWRGITTPVHAVAATVIIAVKAGVSSTVMRLRSASDRATFWSGRKRRLTIVKLSPIELVTFFHDGQLARLRRQWGRVQVWMLKGVDRVDAPLPVEPQEFSEEGNSTTSVPISASVALSSGIREQTRVHLLSEAMAEVAGSRSGLDRLGSG